MYRVYKILGLCFALCLGILISCKDNKDEEKIVGEETQNFKESSGIDADLNTIPYVRSIRVKNIGPLWKVFNDSNYLQLQSAQLLGIEPIEDLNSAYFTRRPLVRISSNRYYQIDSLRHSIPYLVPEAADLLQDIGKNFIDSLHSRGGDSYKIKVTSLLRTPDSVKKLRRVNINATDSSTHQFATTFDISYTNFYCMNENRQINQGDLKNLLGEVLLELRKQGRCLVKYETKTGCFHVTVSK